MPGVFRLFDCGEGTVKGTGTHHSPSHIARLHTYTLAHLGKESQGTVPMDSHGPNPSPPPVSSFPSFIVHHSSLLLDARGLRTSPHMRDVEGHLFRTSGRKGLKGRKGRFDSSTARDDASGLYSEMKSSLKSGRPLRPDVLNHGPCVPQISPPAQHRRPGEVKPRKPRKPAPPDTEGDGKKYASHLHRLFVTI